MSVDIENRIAQIALKYCADYPNIKHCSVMEKLYAIEATLQGNDDAALKDLHEVKGLTVVGRY